MAAETKIGAGAASLDGKLMTKMETTNPAETSPYPQFDEQSESTVDQHEAHFLFEDTDVPWDVGPSFMYFPLHNLDALAKGEVSQPTEDIRASPSYTNHFPGFSGFQTPDICGGWMDFPLQAANAWERPIPERSDHGKAASPSRQQEDLDNEIEWPAYLFQDSNPLIHGIDHYRDSDHLRSISRASSATLAPDTPSRPVSRRSLNFSPATLPASPPKEWTCTQCDKSFQQEPALRSVIRLSALNVY